MVDGLNAVNKRYIYQLMSNVQLPVSKIFDSQMQMQNSSQKDYVSLAKEFQQHLTNKHHKNRVFDQGKWKTIQGKKIDRQIVSFSG